LAERNPAAAGKLATAVLDLVEWLASSAVQGSSHTLRTGEIVRGWPLPPFRIYYQRAEHSLRVVRIYHQKRKPIAR
jgi:plasmid stabilization system protein ParE